MHQDNTRFRIFLSLRKRRNLEETIAKKPASFAHLQVGGNVPHQRPENINVHIKQRETKGEGERGKTRGKKKLFEPITSQNEQRRNEHRKEAFFLVTAQPRFHIFLSLRKR